MTVTGLVLGATLLAGCTATAGEPQHNGPPEATASTATRLTASPSTVSARSSPGDATPPTTAPTTSPSGPTDVSGSPAPPPAEPGTGATPAPAWLGTRPLGPPGRGAVAPQDTPPELLDRRIITVDLLPPPVGEAFQATVTIVPADVLARSTWQEACPVAAEDLRYVTVPFWGFDERRHTGELLLNADAVDAVVSVFEVMYSERFPLEQVGITTAADLDAAPTGDGNRTSSFSCRPVTGGSGWSQHAYGRAIDVNPFHNPYDKGSGAGRIVIPELATAYTDRTRGLPGMITADSPVVAAFRAAGWGWGGDFRSLKDWQHFSANGN